MEADTEAEWEDSEAVAEDMEVVALAAAEKEDLAAVATEA